MILFNKILNIKDELVQFKLIKLSFLDYQLSAQMKLGSKDYMMKRI